MYNEVDYVPLFPTYRKRIMVVASIMAVVGVILFLMGMFGFVIVCLNVETTCNLTAIDGNCNLSLCCPNMSGCKTDCPEDFDNFEGNGWTEIKCYYDSNSMECPEVSCPGDLFPITEMVMSGLALLVSSLLIYTIGTLKIRVSEPTNSD